jgi:uncharacterized protein YidB (DUF937 family)
MSILDTIASLLGKGDGGSVSVPEALVAALGSQECGLGGLVQKFEAAGLGGVLSSWIGSGENQAIAPDALHGILGAISFSRFPPKPGCRSTSSCCRSSHSICRGSSTA